MLVSLQAPGNGVIDWGQAIGKQKRRLWEAAFDNLSNTPCQCVFTSFCVVVNTSPFAVAMSRQ